MTTTTERLDRATFQRRWSDDLAAAHTEARDKWAEAAAETAGELRAFADFLHELDVPGLVAMADDLAAERLAETAEWPAWAELDDPISVDEMVGIYGAEWTGGLTSVEWIRRQRDRDALAPIQPTAVIPAEPDLEMGREIRAALSRTALIRGTYTPDKKVCGQTIEGFFGEVLTCIEPPDHGMPHRTTDGAEFWPRIESEPWQQWLRRSLGDLWKQVWPR